MPKSTFSRVAVAGALMAAIMTTLGGAEAGASTPAATVTTFATSTYSDLYSMASDPSGDIFTVDDSSGTIIEYANASSTPTILGVDGASPIGVTYHDGLLYISNDGGSISTFSMSTKTLSTLVSAPSATGGEAGGSQFVFDAAGDLFVANYSNNVIGEVKANTTTEITAPIKLTSGCDPWGLAVQSHTVLVSCYDSGQLLSAAFPPSASGESANPIQTPGLSAPSEMAVDSAGNAYVANYGADNLVEIHANGSWPSVLVTKGVGIVDPFGVSYTKGSLYVLASSSSAAIDKVTLSSAKQTITCKKGTKSKKVTAENPVCPRGYKIPPPPSNAVASTVFSGTYGSLYASTSDSSGNNYYVDYDTGVILKFGAGASSPTVLATDTSTPIGITYHDGTLYIVNTNGSIDSLSPSGGSLTDIVASPSVAGSEAGGPQIVFDSSNTMYVANYTGNVIGMVAPNASTETTAGITLPSGCGPWGMAIRATTLLISCYDTGTLLHAALPVPAGGETATVLNAANAILSEPGEMATDNAGNVYIANEEGSDIVELPAKSTQTSILATRGAVMTYPWSLTWSNGALFTSLYTTPNSIVKITLLKPITTITCVKGKVVKKVTGRGPTCPAHYKKK